MAQTTIRKVLFSESSPNLGGQELQLLQQMEALGERGVAVMLACRPQSGIHVQALKRGLPTVTVALRSVVHWPSIRQVQDIMQSWQPDVVVTHSGHDANVCGIAARLLRSRPRVIRVRTYQPGKPHAWTYNWLADRTLVPSEEMRRRILSNPRIKSDRLQILYPGLPFAELAVQAQSPLPPHVETWLRAHPGPVLAHAAMLRQEKGHAMMLDVVANLQPRFPDLRYVIAGEGPERKVIAGQIAALGLEDQVLHAGMVYPVAALLRRAGLTVMPSLIEPLGMAQIEALSLGVPVVASHVGGIPETITHLKTGVLIAAGDIEAWTEGLAWALVKPDAMQAMAAAGRKDVLARFSVDSNVARFLELIAA
jgi:glycosyltransferase involved in cell wall biosynthesis